MALTEAKHHQSIIGWDNFIRGFTSTYWMKAQSIKMIDTAANAKRRGPWNIRFVRGILNLHRQIWEARNKQTHGNMIQENHQKPRRRILGKVKELYTETPLLAPLYPAIREIPIDCRLRCPTRHLQEWIARIEHQKAMSAYLLQASTTSQLTIKEAFARVQNNIGSINKYPP